MSLSYMIYRAVSSRAGPLARMVINRRLRKGKEDPERFEERFGEATRPRPDGALIWLHAASVGESLTVLPLIRSLAASRSDLTFLVTTGTVTSAQLMEERLPSRAFHQFVPVDTPQAVDRFLDHWRPDACLWVESELWPNLVTTAAETGVPMALINARFSAKSLSRWRYAPGLFRKLIGAFDVILTQTDATADLLIDKGLDAEQVHAVGNLKEAADRLPYDPMELTRLTSIIGERPRWLAASTHPGEEMAAVEAYRALQSRTQNLLTIIAPRHPERGAEIAELMVNMGVKAKRRALAELPDADTEVYIADTLGELGLWYRMTPIAFVGGSMTPRGGHNPFEPAALRTGILHGPHVANFAREYARLNAAGGAVMVDGSISLSAALSGLFDEHGDPTETARNMAAQAVMLSRDGARVLEMSVDLLEPLLPPKPATPDLSEDRGADGGVDDPGADAAA